MKKLNCTGSFIPGGPTGNVHVLGVAINLPLKALIKEAFERHYEQHEAGYEDGKFSQVSNRPQLLAHWVNEAQDTLHKRYQSTIVEAFRKVGMNLDPDGFEDSELQIIKRLECIMIGDYSHEDLEDEAAAERDEILGLEDKTENEDSGTEQDVPASTAQRRRAREKNWQY